MRRLPEDELRLLPEPRQAEYRRLVAAADSAKPQRTREAQSAVEQFIADTEDTRAHRRREAEDAAQRECAGLRERLREIEAERAQVKGALEAMGR